MDLQSDDFFGSCNSAKISSKKVPQNLTIELLGYHARDNIRIENILVSFVSPTWIGNPLQYEILDVGWSGTNYKSYEDGGVHLIKTMKSKNPGWYQFIRRTHF